MTNGHDKMTWHERMEWVDWRNEWGGGNDGRWWA